MNDKNEIMAEIEKHLRKKQIEMTKEEIQNSELSLNFLNLIDGIDLSANNYRSVFADGDTELIYDNGEFFLSSTTDVNKAKKKKSRKEATEIYVEYFIRYQLNPLLKQKELDKMTKTITKDIIIKEEKDKKTVSKSTVKPKIKDDSLER